MMHGTTNIKCLCEVGHYLLLEPRLRMNGAIPLLPLYPFLAYPRG